MEGLHCADRLRPPLKEGTTMVSVQNIWQSVCRNRGKVATAVILLTTFFVAFVYLNSNSDLDRKSKAIAVNLSKRLGVPYPEAYAISRTTLLESMELPEHGGFLENIWYGSPRIRYLENTIETKLRRSGFSGFWLGSEVRAAVRSGLREVSVRPPKNNK